MSASADLSPSRPRVRSTLLAEDPCAGSWLSRTRPRPALSFGPCSRHRSSPAPLGGCEVVEASSGFDAMRLLPRGPVRPDRHRHQHGRHQRPRAHSLHPQVGPPQRRRRSSSSRPCAASTTPSARSRSARTCTSPSRSPRSSSAAPARRCSRLRPRGQRPRGSGAEADDGRWRRTRRERGARRVLQRGAGARRRARPRSPRARRAAEEGAVRRRADQRRLPRGAHAQGPLGALRGHAHGGALAPARGRARRPAPRPARAHDARCSTCSSRPCRSTPASSRRRRARPPEPVHDVEQLLVALGQVSGKRTGGGVGDGRAVRPRSRACSACSPSTKSTACARTSRTGSASTSIRVRFSLATIDSALDELKANARPHGEIITYLPTGAGADADTIELEILMASRVVGRRSSAGAIKRPGRRHRGGPAPRASTSAAPAALRRADAPAGDEPFAPPTVGERRRPVTPSRQPARSEIARARRAEHRTRSRRSASCPARLRAAALPGRRDVACARSARRSASTSASSIA